MKQIPREGAAFREMDGIWRRIMAKTKEQPLVMEVADFPGLLQELEKCNQQLEIVEKGEKMVHLNSEWTKPNKNRRYRILAIDQDPIVY